jgi:hypothetical protein
VPFPVGLGFHTRTIGASDASIDPTAAHCDAIVVAIELSQRSWLVTLHCPDRDRISHHGLESGDHGGLLALIDRVRERAALSVGTGTGSGELRRGRL